MPSVLRNQAAPPGVDRHSKDVQTAVFEIEAQPAVAEKAVAPAFSEESIRDAAAMINAAKRPVLYLGGGVINAPASA